MYKNNTFLAIIPARSGSKGIPNKNIKIVSGKPLLQYTIDEAKKSKYIDKLIVSTDDFRIGEIARSCGAEVPFYRPSYLADDTAKTIDVILHALNKMKKNGEKYDYIILLQPTQPLRKSWHIDEAVESIVNNYKESLVSVSLVKEHPVLMRTINKDGDVQNVLNMQSSIRRQDFPNFYKVNGSIYINKINKNLNKYTSLNDNTYAYIMSNEYDLDIDEPLDLEIFRFILEKNSMIK